jgi:hypothetical protein
MSRVLWAWLLVGLFVFPAWARYGGGLGTAAQPYLISTAAQLNAVGAAPDDWDKCFKLTANINLRDLGSTPFKRIGTSSTFTGVFDGNYKTISNLRLVSDGSSYIGLFGVVGGDEARIVNLTLLDPNVVDESGRYVGALAGHFSRGTITNCHVRGGDIQGTSLVGGLVGYSNYGTITDCTVAATVRGSSRVGGLAGATFIGEVTRCQAVGEVLGETDSWSVGGLIGENQTATVTACRACSDVRGDDRVGGLVGENINALISRCYAEGTVRGTSNVGGLVGKNTGAGTTDCYALAAVTAVTYAGGLVGYNAPSCDCTDEYVLSLIARCYAAGPVKGSLSGGLVGLNHNKLNHFSRVDNSFWDIKTSGCTTSDGGAGMTTLQMSSLSTYLNAGWDFAGEKTNGTKDFWLMPIPRSYPRFAWEPSLADLNDDGRVDFRDYALLAKRWRQVDNGSVAGGQFVAPDGVVGLDDLTNLADLWLAHRW